MVFQLLPHTIGGLSEVLWLGEVESLQAEVAQGVKCVVYAEIFVGEAGSRGISQSAEGFD
jgi:hypothetical protein